MLEYRIGLQRSLGIPPTSRVGSYRLSPSDFVNTTMKHFDFAQRA
jgi:hypothetical protein